MQVAKRPGIEVPHLIISATLGLVNWVLLSKITKISIASPEKSTLISESGFSPGAIVKTTELSNPGIIAGGVFREKRVLYEHLFRAKKMY